jgi:hypothetical protein
MARRLERYESFRNIDCVGMCREVMQALGRHIDAKKNPFWQYFAMKRERALAAGLDDLRVLHSYVHTIREILTAEGDEPALALLSELEDKCM